MDQPTPEEEGQASGTGSSSNHYPAELEQVTTTESRLVLARAGRTRAESERQNIANEILLSTKDVCQKLISDGESTLARARDLETKAEQKHLEALGELEQAKSTREEAVVFAAKVVVEANQGLEEAGERATALRQETDNYAEKVKAEARQQAEKLETEAATILEDANAHAEKIMSEAKEQTEEAEKHAAAVKEAADANAEAVISQAKDHAERFEEQAEESEEHAASVKETADAYAEAVISQAKNHAERVEEQAAAVLEEAKAHSEAVKAEAQQQVAEIVQLARAAAEQEVAGVRQQSQEEAGQALAEVETARVAVHQELEAQQIYTESARVTVESLEVLGQIRAKLAEYSLYSGGDPISESADDDQFIVEQPQDSQPEDSPSGNLSDDQLRAWLDGN